MDYKKQEYKQGDCSNGYFITQMRDVSSFNLGYISGI